MEYYKFRFKQLLSIILNLPKLISDNKSTNVKDVLNTLVISRRNRIIFDNVCILSMADVRAIVNNKKYYHTTYKALRYGNGIDVMSWVLLRDAISRNDASVTISKINLELENNNLELLTESECRFIKYALECNYE